MMEKIKNNMKPTLVLGIICIIVAALLAAVNLITGPEIERRKAEAITASLTEVMPDGRFNTKPDELGDDAPKTIKAVYTDLNGGGKVFVLETSSEYTSGANMGITVAIDNDGNIIGVKLTSYSETKDFGKNYPDSYVGLNADGVASAPLVSGVTYSSSAFRSAIFDAMKYIGAASGELEAPDTSAKPEIQPLRSEDDVKAAALAIAEGATSLTDITPPAKYRPYNSVRFYELDGGLGYVAYVITLGWGDYPVSEGLVHIDINGDIKKAQILTWVPGGGSPNYDVPPFTEEHLKSYEGKDLWHVGGADLVTGATGTSGDFRAAVTEAVRYFSINKLERTDKKVLELVKEFLPFATDFEQVTVPNAPETLKRLYKVSGVKGGYVAHVSVAGDYTPVATEALVYIDVWGKIADIELLIWNVGHGVEAGDFAEGFIGKDKDSVADVELVSAATGTSTDFKDEIAKILPLVPTTYGSALAVAIVISAIWLFGGIAVLIYFKRRNRAK